MRGRHLRLAPPVHAVSAHERIQTMKAGVLLLGMAVCVPAFAQSSMTLYGIVDDAVGYVSNDKGHSNTFLSNGLNGPRFGFEGKEQISPHTQAFFDLEQGFTDAGADAASGLQFQRKSLVGLKNDSLGSISLGRQYSPYYTFVGPLSASSQVDGTQLAQPGDLNGLDTTMRLNRSVVYTTPEVAGLKASIAYAFGGVAGAMGSGDSYSAAIAYRHGGFKSAAGYTKMRNTGNVAGAWDSSSSGSFIISSLNTGFSSAASVQLAALGATYQQGALTVGITASNVQYAPGRESLFSDTEVFNSIGTTFSWYVTPDVDLAGGYDYTHASRSNGMQEGAQYHEVGLTQIYHFSKTVSVFIAETYEHASGQTLSAAGGHNVVDATAAIGDGFLGTAASSSGNQLFGMAGIDYKF